MRNVKTPPIPKNELAQMLVEIQNVSAGISFPKDTARFPSGTEEEALNNILPALIDRLRMSTKYLVFDLLATRRENKLLKQENAHCKSIIQEMFEDENERE